jgi:hypothetical protein
VRGPPLSPKLVKGFADFGNDFTTVGITECSPLESSNAPCLKVPAVTAWSRQTPGRNDILIRPEPVNPVRVTM